MKPKQILTVLLLVFVAVSIAYMSIREQETATQVSEEADKPVPAANERGITENTIAVANENIQNTLTNNKTKTARQHTQLIVYYFHGDMRCPTCHKLETYAKEALDTYFPDKLASQDIVWKVVNVDKPKNRHFIRDYELVTKSVVLSKSADGKEIERKNLDQIWQKVRDKNSYLNYIRGSIIEFIVEEKS